MILQCPECQARFAVPDALIPPEGRTVKCGRCAHQWHCEGKPPEEGAESFADMAAAAQADSEAEPTPIEPRQLPVVQPQPISARPFMIAALVLLVLWPVILLAAHYQQWIDAPVARNLYAMAGIHTTEGLAFDEVTMQKNPTADGQTQYLISGSINNHAAENRLVPAVRVALKNKDGKTIWARDYAVGETLKPGGAYPFRIDNVTTSFADSVASIVLDLGNGLQLTMR